MILVDLNQVMLSSFMMSLTKTNDIEINEDLLRHMILNSIRANRTKFKKEFGELVIASDGNEYWRRDVFPYYKANRKKVREASAINWNDVFNSLNKIRDELRDYFPYPVIHYSKSEADDIIATLVKNENMLTPILILSGDKDFVQLHPLGNVKQYDPTRKKWVSHHAPEKYLREHIIRGDSGDGIPNILSKDDTFVVGDRQKKIMSKNLDSWIELEPEQYCDSNMLRNYHRNASLIDLSKIPNDVEHNILTIYQSQQGKNRSQLFNYFMKNKLKNMMEAINEF